MTRLATALILFAGGITAANTGHDLPTVTPSAVTPGKHRHTEPPVSRSMRRLPAPHRKRHHDRPPRPRVTHSGVRQPHNWDAVATCESSGNWSANTGNGYFGGLQFSLSTWAAFGGHGLPSRASRADQIRVAELVLASQGAGAWPVCGVHL